MGCFCGKLYSLAVWLTFLGYSPKCFRKLNLWTLVLNIYIILIQHPSGQVVQLCHEQDHGVLGEDLAEGQSSKGSRERGCIWLVFGHYKCFSRFNSRANSVQNIYQ